MQPRLWRRETYPEGSAIFQQGDTGLDAYLVESGSVNISQSDADGRVVLLKRLNAGEVFGEIALVDKLPRTATASAAKTTVLIAINSQFFHDKLKNSDPLLAYLLALLVSRLRANHQPSNASEPLMSDHMANLQNSAASHIQRSQDISEAIEREEFKVFYQPVVHLEDGSLAGFEALLRWDRPGLGIVSPSEFIGLAELTGLILPLSRWMTAEALRGMKVFESAIERHHGQHHTGCPSLFMSINLSARQLLDTEEINAIIAIIHESAIAPSRIKLEITESMVMDNIEKIILTMHQLKKVGVLLAIDDFGTGYSSLSYLDRMPLDNLKIDRSFVLAMRNQNNKSNGHRIARAIAALAHELGMDCIAEGIEDGVDEQALKILGCKYGQGYLYAKPLSQADALAYIAEHATL